MLACVDFFDFEHAFVCNFVAAEGSVSTLLSRRLSILHNCRSNIRSGSLWMLFPSVCDRDGWVVRWLPILNY